MPKNNVRPPQKVARNSRYARRHPDEEEMFPRPLLDKQARELFRDAVQRKQRTSKNAPR